MISLPERISDTIRAIIEKTGRPVTFETIVYLPCVTCSGHNPFCSQCHGTNVVPTVSGLQAVAKIEWKNANKRVYKSASHDFEGDARLTLAFDAVLYSGILKSKHVVVDNYRCKINATYPGGININRIYVLVTQEERNQRTG